MHITEYLLGLRKDAPADLASFARMEPPSCGHESRRRCCSLTVGLKKDQKTPGGFGLLDQQPRSLAR